MKILSSRNRLTIIIFLFLVFVGTCTYLIQEGIWANIHSQGMMRLAEENWDKGEYFNSIYWYRSAYSTALMGGLRWEIFRIYAYRMDKFRELGKLSEALEVCKQATRIWDQEGAATYTCLSIEQEMLKEK